jgi:hypothetical protein
MHTILVLPETIDLAASFRLYPNCSAVSRTFWRVPSLMPSLSARPPSTAETVEKLTPASLATSLIEIIMISFYLQRCRYHTAFYKICQQSFLFFQKKNKM